MDHQKNTLAERFPDVTVGPGVQVLGIANIEIGSGTCIGKDTWLNVCLRDEQIRMRIGRCVCVGRRGVINTNGYLEIGDYCLIGPNVYVGDADHVYANIRVPLMYGGVTTRRSVIVEENCWLAMNSVVSGNLRIGRGSVVGANSLVNRDVPPFCVVVGNPARIVKMFDPVLDQWVAIRSDTERAAVEAHRRQKPFPSREEYRQMLDRCGLTRVDPIVAGGECHL